MLHFTEAYHELSFSFAIRIPLLHEWESRLCGKNAKYSFQLHKGLRDGCFISIWFQEYDPNSPHFLIMDAFGTHHSLVGSPLKYFGTKPKAVLSKDEYAVKYNMFSGFQHPSFLGPVLSRVARFSKNTGSCILSDNPIKARSCSILVLCHPSLFQGAKKNPWD